MRAIDADAFDERVRVAGGMSEEELTEDFKDGVQAVLYMLSNQPTIQPELSTNLAEVGTDCISRQEAIDALNEVTIVHSITDFDAISAILDLPPIQPKRGKWIKTARWGRVYYCDQCRNYLDFDGVNAGRGSTNFCPNCGADMRGEQND